MDLMANIGIGSASQRSNCFEYPGLTPPATPPAEPAGHLFAPTVRHQGRDPVPRL
jgi:hypothetical protein